MDFPAGIAEQNPHCTSKSNSYVSFTPCESSFFGWNSCSAPVSRKTQPPPSSQILLVCVSVFVGVLGAEEAGH